MREHDYLYHGSYAYRDISNKLCKAQKSAATYRAQYLELRRDMRDFFKSRPDIELPDEIRKSIGMRK